MRLHGTDRTVMNLKHLVLTVAVLAAAAPALQPTPAGASGTCAPRTTRSISGSVTGLDNRDVNVSIGFDVESSTGAIINVSDGCAKTGGYSQGQTQLNHYVAGVGVAQHSLMKDGRYTIRNWNLPNLPSNAKYVWIEVYSRGYNGSPCLTCFSPSDTHKYGYAMRRRVPVGATGVNIKLPLTCGTTWHGSAGGIMGRVVNGAGAPVTVTNVYAWSEAPDNSPALTGWGTAKVSGNGYSIGSLAPNQLYTMFLYAGGKQYIKHHVPVSTCTTTPLRWLAS